MSRLKSSILSESNLTMIGDISIKKIYNISGILLNRDEPFFKNNFMMIVLAIIEEEESGTLPVTKINGIIIKEVINFIIQYINNEKQETEELSTKLDLEDDDFFEDLKIDTVEQQNIIHPVPATTEVDKMMPIFENDIYSFETSDMDKTVDGYMAMVRIDKVKEIQMIEFSIDNSDYTVTEYGNTFAIDNVDISIDCGNYTVNELEAEIHQQIISKIDDNIEFKLNRKTDSFYIQSLAKKTKSLTGSLKEQKSYHIDFGTANSINKILGFESKSYKLNSGETIEGVKHKLCTNQYVNILIGCGSNELKYKVLMDTDYNKTKYFTPKDNKMIINSDATLFTVDKLVVKITDMYGNLYNTRGRNFNISFRINQLKN